MRFSVLFRNPFVLDDIVCHIFSKFLIVTTLSFQIRRYITQTIATESLNEAGKFIYWLSFPRIIKMRPSDVRIIWSLYTKQFVTLFFTNCYSGGSCIVMILLVNNKLLFLLQQNPKICRRWCQILAPLNILGYRSPPFILVR